MSATDTLRAQATEMRSAIKYKRGAFGHDDRIEINELIASLTQALSDMEDERDEYREILGDLVSLDGEESVMGRWPGFKDRYDRAWDRAREKFEP